MKLLKLPLPGVIQLDLMLNNLQGKTNETMLRWAIKEALIPGEEFRKEFKIQDREIPVGNGQTALVVEFDKDKTEEIIEILLEDAQFEQLKKDIDEKDDWVPSKTTMGIFEAMGGVEDVKPQPQIVKEEKKKTKAS